MLGRCKSSCQRG